MKKGIGEKIRQARREANLTQKELANKIGISTPTVGNWEINNFKPDSINIHKLAEVLNKPISYFFDENTNDIWNNIGHRVSRLEAILHGRDIISNDAFIEIPILGKVPAGTLEKAIEHKTGSICVIKTYDIVKGKTFALVVNGYSISIAPKIEERDVIIITQDISIKPGDIVLIRENEKIVIKQFSESDTKIIGKVVAAYKKF